MIVTCAIIKKENKFLITQRPNDGRSNAGRWEFPGGKVENESNEECLVREIKEELGVDIEVHEQLAVSEYKNIQLIAFKCIMKGEIQKLDIKDYAWVEDFSKYEMCEADMLIIKLL